MVPTLFDSPDVIPRNTHVLFGLMDIPWFRTFSFSNEMSAPESTRNEHSLFEALMDTLMKLDAATLIEYIDPMFLKNLGSVVDWVN